MEETKVLVECGVTTTKFPPLSRDGTAGRVQKPKECRCARCRYCVKSFKSLVLSAIARTSSHRWRQDGMRLCCHLVIATATPPSVGGRRRIRKIFVGSFFFPQTTETALDGGPVSPRDVVLRLTLLFCLLPRDPYG